MRHFDNSKKLSSERGRREQNLEITGGSLVLTELGDVRSMRVFTAISMNLDLVKDGR